MPNWEGKEYSYDDLGYKELMSDMLQLMHSNGDPMYVQNTELKKFQHGINQLTDYLGVEPIAVDGEWNSETKSAYNKFASAAKLKLHSQPPGDILGEGAIMGSEIENMYKG